MSTKLEQFLFHFKYVSCYNRNNRNNHLPLYATRTQQSALWSDPKATKLSSNHQTLPLVVPAASVSGSGPADYSAEQLLDTRSRRKKLIGGVDQDELLDPVHLADSDSCFSEFRGVHIHYKLCEYDPPQANTNHVEANSNFFATRKEQLLGIPMILLHGFGASVYSWSRVMKPLAQLIGSKVLAFDRPAFGLTSRVFPSINKNPPSSSANNESRPLNPYSMLFSVLATLHFIDFLAGKKAILVGHSAGSFVAVNSYFEAPERVAALILIAPAIVAPLKFTAPKKVAQEDKKETNNGSEGDSSKFKFLQYLGKPIARLTEILLKFSMLIGQAIVQMLKGTRNMLNNIYNKILSATLRSAVGVMLVRMVIDKFGVAAVRSAWCDSKKVSEDVLQGYTKPLRCKGWDRALVEFTAAMLIDNESEKRPPLIERLDQISCPVLIITGDRDRIVPSWNAERLSRAIPGSCFQVIKNCGHLPHEEKVQEFIAVVEKFLQTALGNSETLLLQADS